MMAMRGTDARAASKAVFSPLVHVLFLLRRPVKFEVCLESGWAWHYKCFK